jgi:diglucosylglycerate octanoyltransferase
VQRVLILGDSLAFHGPTQPELLTHPDLYPNVLARELAVEVDVVARYGWTARDIWWALTKDPTVYSILLPRADAVVLAVGGMDSLPASLPTYLREGLAYIRPGWVRRRVRLAYHRAHPRVVRALGGRMRVLPQVATDAYLSRCVRGIRHYRPGVPIVAIAPPPWQGSYYPINRGHDSARAAGLAWAEREGVPILDPEEVVLSSFADGTANSDGMHWGWPVHAWVGKGLAGLLRDLRPDG